LGITEILFIVQLIVITVVVEPISVVAETNLSREFQKVYRHENEVGESEEVDKVAVVVNCSTPASLRFQFEQANCLTGYKE